MVKILLFILIITGFNCSAQKSEWIQRSSLPSVVLSDFNKVYLTDTIFSIHRYSLYNYDKKVYEVRSYKIRLSKWCKDDIIPSDSLISLFYYRIIKGSTITYAPKDKIGLKRNR